MNRNTTFGLALLFTAAALLARWDGAAIAALAFAIVVAP